MDHGWTKCRGEIARGLGPRRRELARGRLGKEPKSVHFSAEVAGREVPVNPLGELRVPMPEHPLDNDEGDASE